MTETDTNTRKTCCACGASKELDLFPKLPTGKWGRSTKCKICMSVYQKEYRLANLERLKENSRQRYIDRKPEYQDARRDSYQVNKEYYKASASRWAKENPEKRKAIAQRWVKENPEKRYETQRRGRLNNPGLYAAHYKMRQQRKRQAMPAWADQDAIRAIYDRCAEIVKQTGIPHDVDHFYPLKNDRVCGLHNEYNLRIVTAFENRSKGNKFPTED